MGGQARQEGWGAEGTVGGANQKRYLQIHTWGPEVGSSGLIAWTTHKCPPWTGRTADWEARSSNLEELDMRCGVGGIRASSAHNWQ